MRVVLDANVFISGILSKKGTPGQIIDAWIDQQFQLFMSDDIVEEIGRVLNYPRIRENMEPGLADRLIEKFDELCEWTDGTLTLDILTQDPSDNIYLACAVEAQAGYLVTGNLIHFLEAGNPFKGVHILTPREFLNVLQTV